MEGALGWEFRGHNTHLAGFDPLFIGRRSRPVACSSCTTKDSLPSGRPVRVRWGSRRLPRRTTQVDCAANHQLTTVTVQVFVWEDLTRTEFCTSGSAGSKPARQAPTSTG